MKIDLETARYYAGLGDLVMWSWLAAGAKQAKVPLVFHRRRDTSLLSMFGAEVTDDVGGLVLDDVYRTEMNERGQRARIDYLREALPSTVPAVRPTVQLAVEDTEWALQTRHELGSPLVLLFPQTAWKPREWPASYWVDLAWQLANHHYSVALFYQGDDARYRNTPRFYWNTSISRIAALMQHASLVIGNDSFPAHLAGTLGVPTLALMGPTRGSVFAHIPNVTCITSALDCTGCHFQTPFRAACDQGCQSLFRLFPDDVLTFALSMLRTAT